MKKRIITLLAVCIVFCMAGCVSQSDLDAVTAERDTLQEKCDALQATIDKYSEIINSMDAEEYETAMEIISEMQSAKATAELGDFYANIVTVELSPDNIADYLEFRPYEIEFVDAFGNGTGNYDCGIALSNKMFDSGLVYWSSEDVAVEVLFTENYANIATEIRNQYWSIWSSGSQALGWEEGSTVLDIPIGAVVYGFRNGEVDQMPDFRPEHLSFGNAKGTITFVKADYVESISNVGGKTVFLKDGQSKMTGYWCNGVDWPDNILG